MRGHVPVAFLATSTTEGNAGREQGFEGLPIASLIRPRHDASGRRADRRTVEIEANATDEAFDMFLG
jgi:hypothetical protein